MTPRMKTRQPAITRTQMPAILRPYTGTRRPGNSRPRPRRIRMMKIVLNLEVVISGVPLKRLKMESW